MSRITGYKYGLLDIDTHGAVQTPLPGNATDMAVVTCDQATMATGVLFFSQARQNAIYADQQDPYCIHLDYTNATEAVRVADRFAYGLLRVMPG